MVARPPRCYVAAVRTYPLAALLALAWPSIGCGHKPTATESQDDPARLTRDADALCTAISDGDVEAWRAPYYISATFTYFVERDRSGDIEAACDAAELLERRWQQTRTCTERLIRGFVERKGCAHRRRGRG